MPWVWRLQGRTELPLTEFTVLPCAYFGKQTTAKVVENFYNQVAEVSPLPIIIYNFPAVCNGLDLDSDVMASLAQKNPNIVGVKLTCASVGKITRLAATFEPSRFAILGGQSDFLIGGLAAGSQGCIAAFCNIFPKTVVKIFVSETNEFSNSANE